MERERTRRRPCSLRGVVAVALLAFAVGGASTPSVPRNEYLSYVVIADRADASGAQRAVDAVRTAGGVLGPVHPELGLTLAYSARPRFAARVRAVPGIHAAGATRTAPLTVPPAHPASAAAGSGPVGAARAAGRRDGAYANPRPYGLRDTGGDAKGPGDTGTTARADDGEPGPPAVGAPPLVPDPGERPTWNLAMIGAAATPAPPETLHGTVVAVLDSGVDDTHPDLRGAVDPARSASCGSGVPDVRPGAWRPLPHLPDSGHGTHIAGTVAAVRDGRGVQGIATGVRVAAVRLVDPAGQYYAENIICGFVWAADHGARVINNSYFADPWKYNCPGDPDQNAVIIAIARAVAYAQSRGALVVASAGNDGQDLDASRIDRRSPNDHRPGSSPKPREVGAECIRLPGGLPAVVGATAVDRTGAPAPYSNHGSGRGWLAAPGGDPSGGPDAQIVSTWPGGRYAALSGTSMAAAHVTAAAAVESARHPQAGPGRLYALLAQATIPPRCPPPSPQVGCPAESFLGRGLLTLDRAR